MHTGRFSFRAYLVALIPRDLGFSRVTCHQFAYSYVPRYLLSFHVTFMFGYDDSFLLPDYGTPMLYDSPYTRAGSSYARDVRLVSYPRRFSLHPVFYPGRFPSCHLPDWTLFLSLTFTDSTPVCTCIVRTCIYTGLEMGRSPSSIYFATTLVL